jgi:hypothetical protein
MQVKLNSDDGDSGSKWCKRGYSGVYGGFWRIVRVAGVWSQAVIVLCMCVWQESGFSLREYLSTFDLVYKEMLSVLYSTRFAVSMLQ